MDRKNHGEMDSQPDRQMDGQQMDRRMMHLQLPVVEFPPRGVVVPEVTTATDAC